MTRKQVLDHYYLEARSRLVDLGAFIDRVERAEGAGDFRWEAFRKALAVLNEPGSDKAKAVLMALSDPTTEPIPAAGTKGACGAWPGPVNA